MTDITAPNPYAAPASNLQNVADASSVPTIEEALSRRYNFSISDVLGEAWRRTKGTKGLIIGGFVVFYAAMFAATLVLNLVFGLFGALTGGGMGFMIISSIISMLATVLAYPFLAGINMIGIRQAAGQPLQFNEIFNHFDRTVPVVITVLLMTLLSIIGYALFVIPGIYLSIAYLLAIPLVVERGLSPWQAMEASRKAISQHWFKVFGLFLLLGILLSLSAIPLGIGLVWTLPMMIVAIGVLYRTIFGVRPVQSN